MGTTGWLGFKELEKALDIHSNTLRRWNELFPTFLGGKKINRVMSFPRESLETFRLIKILYDEGKQTADVIATLAKEMAQTLEVQPIQQGENPSSPPSPPQAPGTGLDLQLAPLVNVLDRLASSLETMATNQQKFLEGVERRLMALEGARNALDEQNGPMPYPAPQKSGYGVEIRQCTRGEIIAEVHRLRGLGYGAGRIARTMRVDGWPSLSGRGKLGKGSVSRILKSSENSL